MAARQDQLTFKYGQPLFAAAWPCADIILVAGGGGRPGTGIENRIIAGVNALHVLELCITSADPVTIFAALVSVESTRTAIN